MSTSTEYTFKGPIWLSTTEFLARKAAGTLEAGREYVFTNVTSVELLKGTTDPTTSTAPAVVTDDSTSVLGCEYLNTTTNTKWYLKSITTGTTNTYNWVKYITTDNIAGSTLGVVKTGTDMGIAVATDGTISTTAATEDELVAKTNTHSVVTPSNIDIAVREGLGNGSATWTETEKENARTILGVADAVDVQINGTSIMESGVANIPYASGSLAGVVKASNNFSATSDGNATCATTTAAEYQTSANTLFISKGTLDNVHRYGGSSLDDTLIAGKQYILDTQSDTFNMNLPTTGHYNDVIEVIFKAGSTFTPTITGGTTTGDAIPQTVANMTYDYGFAWTGSAWLCQWIAY